MEVVLLLSDCRNGSLRELKNLLKIPPISPAESGEDSKILLIGRTKGNWRLFTSKGIRNWIGNSKDSNSNKDKLIVVGYESIS